MQTRRENQCFADNAAANIGRARIALCKLMSGKIARCARQVFIVKLLKIFTEDGGLLQLLGRGGNRFARARELLEGIWRKISIHCRHDPRLREAVDNCQTRKIT